jgi:isochorismate synthase
VIAFAGLPNVSLEAARDALAAGFAAARGRRLPVISFAAPSVPIERFVADAAETVLLDPCCAGEGVAAEVVADGAERFASVKAQAARLFSRIEAHGPVAPRLLGGFAFRDEVDAEEWRGFPAARFVLPRWTHLPGALIHAGEDEASALRELEAIWARLERKPAEPAGDRGPRAMAIETEPSLAGWTLAVEDVLAAIRKKHAEKIVLARSSRLRFDAPIDDRAVLARLARAQGGLRYLIRTAGASFVGATPERLIAKHGARIEADALAGTSGADNVELLRDDKQLREHDLVVKHVSARLGVFAISREEIAKPAIRAAGSIRHLHTPIRMRAKAGVTVLELAAALHPTPAVCGAPTSFALEKIARAEKFARGWYTGAVGWFDANHDGELYVALRCALLRNNAAYLYAGAGLVEGSRALDEYLETALKERVMTQALGVAS